MIPPKAGSEQPISGGAPGQATADPLRYDALKVPLLRARLTSGLQPRSAAAAPSSLARAVPRAIVVAGALALIIAGKFVYFYIPTVEPREPYVAIDSIEAWLRRMTIIRAPPADQSPLEPPEDH